MYTYTTLIALEEAYLVEHAACSADDAGLMELVVSASQA